MKYPDPPQLKLPQSGPPQPEPLQKDSHPKSGDWVRLVTLAQRGDIHAFDALVRRFQDAVVAYSAAILGDFHRAEDAAQDAFLEAYRTLPALRIPAAFPDWMRRLAHKHCDRWTRRKQVITQPLESAYHLSDLSDPSGEVVRRETLSAVRAAIQALPDNERQVMALYYGVERSVKEVATFLGVPVSTVKNRLHTARRRIHERMLPQMAETLDQQRPSHDDRFRERVFVRLQNEFLDQYRHDPSTADRALMARAREEFEQYLANGGPLDPDAAHFGSYLYSFLGQYAALADLIARYRAQVGLPLAEEAWARWEHIRSLAAVDRCEDVVREQRAFVIWAREHLPGDPPIRLSDPGAYGFRPLKDDEATNTDEHTGRGNLPTDSLRPWLTNTSSVALCFKEMGLQDEWAETVRELLQNTPKTRATRLHRFWALRNAVVMYYGPETLAEARTTIDAIQALSDEDPDNWEASRWPIEAAYMQMVACTRGEKPEEARPYGEEAVRLLEAWGPQIPSADTLARSSFHILCDNVASSLADLSHCDLAIRIFPEVLAQGGSGWAHIRYAGCLWTQTGQRDQVLDLLRRAAPRELSQEMKSFFLSRTAFADVHEDPEFLAAVSLPS